MYCVVYYQAINSIGKPWCFYSMIVSDGYYRSDNLLPNECLWMVPGLYELQEDKMSKRAKFYTRRKRRQAKMKITSRGKFKVNHKSRSGRTGGQ